MDYSQSISYIHSMPKFPKELGFDRFSKVLSLLGNPQLKLNFIHIAGTNGKGSIAIYLSAVLSCAGIKTGKFISPYIEVFNERISIDGTNIPDNDLSRLTTKVKSCLDNNSHLKLLEFELVTLIGFLYFAEQNCDVVVLETGLGGRLDSTNVIPSPLVSVITRIDFDHMQYLGNTLLEIAYEKCGIIKEGCPVVVYPDQPSEALDVIKSSAEEKNSVLYIAGAPEVLSSSLWKSVFSYGEHKNVEIHLSGDYQILNAATALETLELLKHNYNLPVTEQAILQGFALASHPVRFEIISKSPYIILDGGHNPNGISAFSESLLKYTSGKKVIAVMGMLEDKEVEECVGTIAKNCKLFIGTRVPNLRSAKEDAICSIAKKYCPAYSVPDPLEAVKTAIANADKDDFICVVGSLYLLGEIRKTFLKGGHNK